MILCADDNPLDVDLLLLAFAEIELEPRIDVVRDGQEALDYLQYEGAYVDRPKAIPEAIILDIKMPKLDGIEVLKVIRYLPELENVPIIMLTSSEMMQDIKACYEYGVNAYVVKPIDFDEFIVMVRSVRNFWTFLNRQKARLGVG